MILNAVLLSVFLGVGGVRIQMPERPNAPVTSAGYKEFIYHPAVFPENRYRRPPARDFFDIPRSRHDFRKEHNPMRTALRQSATTNTTTVASVTTKDATEANTTSVTPGSKPSSTTAAGTGGITGKSTPRGGTGGTGATTEEPGEAAEARPAKEGQFPYMARMYVRGSSYLVSCTAALFKDGVVLTSGRCCEVNMRNAEVVVGRVSHERYVKNADRENYYIYKVRETYLHPKLDRYQGKTMHDLCFVYLDASTNADGQDVADFETRVLPPNASCAIVGWGQRGSKLSKNVLGYREVRPYCCGDFYCIRNSTGQSGESGRMLVCNGAVYGVGGSHLSSLIGNEDSTSNDYFGRLCDNKLFIKMMACSVYPTARNGRPGINPEPPGNVLLLVLLIFHLLCRRLP